jgi:membrane protein YdbS with pleckstrin-like domain
MKLLRGLTMSLAFGLEIAMVFSFAVWGVTVAPTGWMQAVLAVSASAAVIAVWGLLLAPRAEHRLSRPWRLIAEAGLLTLAALTLVSIDRVQSGVAMEALVCVRFLLGGVTGVDQDVAPRFS